MSLQEVQARLDDLTTKFDILFKALKIPDPNQKPLVIADMEETLTKYHEYLIRERKLTEVTARNRIGFLRHFLNRYKTISAESVKNFLYDFQLQTNPYNQRVKSLLPFLRDYCQRPDLVQGIKLEQEKFVPVNAPTKEEIQEFYPFLRYGEVRAIFLGLAASGLRREELLGIKVKDLDLVTGKVDVSKVHTGKTKHSNFSFLNKEAIDAVLPLVAGKRPEDRVFSLAGRTIDTCFKEASDLSGVRIRPKDLRTFFSNEMVDRGMPESKVDFLQGRLSKSVMRRHYLDYLDTKIKKFYDKAALTILSVCYSKALIETQSLLSLYPA